MVVEILGTLKYLGKGRTEEVEMESVGILAYSDINTSAWGNKAVCVQWVHMKLSREDIGCCSSLRLRRGGCSGLYIDTPWFSCKLRISNFLFSSSSHHTGLQKFPKFFDYFAMQSADDFPLEKVTDAEIQQLCKTLWSWSPCQGCDVNRQCELGECASRRKKHLARYFGYYRDMVGSYAPDTGEGQKLALKTHQDLFEVISILKQNPDLSRAELTMRIFDAGGCSEEISTAEKEKALDLAVRVFLMVGCVAESRSLRLLEAGPHQVLWRRDLSFAHCISAVFPISTFTTFSSIFSALPADRRKDLTVRKLKKVARLTFEPTDDIHSHLRLDHKTGKVLIFHHTAFLREHLKLTKGLADNVSLTDSLRIGALPRQLALEILDSIQKIIFPLSDHKSLSLLALLTGASSSTFDPDCLHFDPASIRDEHEKEVEYLYLGERLNELYAKSNEPRPRGRFESWLERRSRPRYVMLATLIGVMIAVLLGLAGLAVTIFQTWITYQSWKHPVQN